MQATLDLAAPSREGSLDDFFFNRLQALVERRYAAVNPTERVALSIEAFAVFLDCLDLGLHDEAHALLEQLHGAQEVPA